MTASYRIFEALNVFLQEAKIKDYGEGQVLLRPENTFLSKN